MIAPPWTAQILRELLARAKSDAALAEHARRLERALVDAGDDAQARAILTDQLRQAERWAAMLGELLAHAERPPEAPVELERAVPHDRRARIERALGDGASGGFQELAAAVAQAIVAPTGADVADLVVPAKWPDPWRQHVGTLDRGLRALRVRETTDALVMLELLLGTSVRRLPSVELEPAVEAGLCVLAGRLLLDGDPLRAKCYVDRAQRLAPDSARVWAALGDVHRKRKQLGDAVSCYQEAISLDTRCVDGYVCMGLYHEDDSSWDEADTWYKTAVELAAASSDPLRELTGLYLPRSRRCFAKLASALAGSASAQALRVADAAVGLPIRGPSTGLGLLHGELLEDAGRASEAVDAYLAAAKNTATSRPYALDLLARASKLAPARLDVAWRYVDALLVASNRDRPPWIEPALVLESLEEWKRAFAIDKPDSEHGWAYVCRGLIHEQLARFDRYRARALWETIAWAEQALLRMPEHTVTWCMLSRACRALWLPSAALQASARAREIDPEGDAAREERLITTVNLDEWDEARQLLAVMEAKTPGAPWLAAIRAHMRLYDPGEPIEVRVGPALALIAHARQDGAGDYPWLKRDHARAAMITGDRDTAHTLYQELWAQRRFDWADDRDEALWAGLMIGETDAVIRQVDAQLDGEPEVSTMPLQVRGLAKLRAGLIEDGVRDVRASFASPRASWDDLRDFTRGACDEILADLASWAKPAEAAAVLAPIFAEMRARAATGKRAAVGDEVAEAERHWDDAPEPLRAIVRVAAALMRARVASGAERHALYRGLVANDHAPEALTGLVQSLSQLEAAADALARAGAHDAAERSYLDARRLADTLPGEEARRDAIAVKLAMLAVLQDRRAVALDAFQAAITAMARGAAVGAVGEVGARVVEHCAAIASDAAVWRADELWRELADASDDTGAFAACRDAWLARLGETRGLHESSASAHGFYTVVTPIAIELGRGVLADDAAARLGDEWTAASQRIAQDTGIAIPVVRWRISADERELDDGYLIMIEEIPLVLGHIEPGRRFVDAPRDLVGSGLPPDAVIAAAAAFAHGCWVAVASLAEVESRGFAPWSTETYIAKHVERVVRNDIARFVAADEVDAMLRRWAADDDCLPHLTQLLSRPGAAPALARIFGEIARDGLPLTDGRVILGALADGSADPLALWPAVQRIRHRLREVIAAHSAGLRRLPLPARVEQMFARAIDPDGQFLAMPPGDVQEVLSEVRALVDGEPARCALVVESAGVRPFVRRLVEIEFPALRVVSLDEIGDGAPALEPALAGAAP